MKSGSPAASAELGGGRYGQRIASTGARADTGRGRVFDQGDLRYVILALIAEKPRHGYELIRPPIEDKLGGAYSPSPGVVYPTLTLLEELGHAPRERRRRRQELYEITPEGTAFLEANRPTVDAIFGRAGRGQQPRAASRPRRSCGRSRTCASRCG